MKKLREAFKKETGDYPSFRTNPLIETFTHDYVNWLEKKAETLEIGLKEEMGHVDRLLDQTKNETVKQSTNEEIRAALFSYIEEENIDSATIQLMDELEKEYHFGRGKMQFWIDGFKARDKSAQAEIENIKEWNIKIVKKKDAEIEKWKDIAQDFQNLYDRANSRIAELEQSLIDMAKTYQSTLDKLKKQYKSNEHKCCGHCKRESDHA